MGLNGRPPGLAFMTHLLFHVFVSADTHFCRITGSQRSGPGKPSQDNPITTSLEFLLALKRRLAIAVKLGNDSPAGNIHGPGLIRSPLLRGRGRALSGLLHVASPDSLCTVLNCRLRNSHVACKHENVSVIPESALCQMIRPFCHGQGASYKLPN